MPLAIRNGKLLLNRSGNGLRTNCLSSCTVQLTKYTYSPCTQDAGGAHNYHRALMLYPSACTMDLSEAQPALSWQSLSNVTGISWNYTKDSDVISVVKAQTKQSKTVGCASIELGGSNAERGTMNGPCAVKFENEPCCTSNCNAGNAFGHFYYRVTVSGTCGKAYCFWHYGDEGTPTKFSKSDGTIYLPTGRIWQSPAYTFTAGTHDIDRQWGTSSTNHTIAEGPGLIVVFLP